MFLRTCFTPGLAAVDAAVQARLSLNPLRAEMLEETLFVAEGPLEAIKFKIKRGLLMAAARPLNEFGFLEHSAPTYLRFKDTCPELFGPTNVQLCAFRSPAFIDLVERVRLAQVKCFFSLPTTSRLWI